MEQELTVFMIGDVVGRIGCSCLERLLPKLKQQYQPAAIIVNGENSENGNGISPRSAELILRTGADVITTGNHAFQRKEAAQAFEQRCVLRPLNYPEGCIGSGVYELDLGPCRIAVVSLMGTTFLEPLDNPFSTMERLLETLETPNIFVDFHAEATSEKQAMGYFLAGRVTAVVGTHTHVQTADETILQGGTGYITDLGMTGPEYSVIGQEVEKTVARFRYRAAPRPGEAEGACMLCGAAIRFDRKSGRCTKIERFIFRE